MVKKLKEMNLSYHDVLVPVPNKQWNRPTVNLTKALNVVTNGNQVPFENSLISEIKKNKQNALYILHAIQTIKAYA